MRTFLHSCAQRLGLQRLSSTIAIRVILSAIDGRVKESARQTSKDSTYLCLSGPPVPEIGIRTTWLPSIPSAKSRLSDWWFGQSPRVRRFSFWQLARPLFPRHHHQLNAKGRRLQRQKVCREEEGWRQGQREDRRARRQGRKGAYMCISIQGSFPLCRSVDFQGKGGLKAATAVNVRHVLCEKHSKVTEALQRIQVR